jgi:hypothetical protein
MKQGKLTPGQIKTTLEHHPQAELISNILTQESDDNAE